MTSESEIERGASTADADGRLQPVRRLYDEWSHYYDWNPVLALVRPARVRAVEAMDLSPGDTVVDMGTGTGANLPHLRAAVGDEGRVIGIDASPGMLDRARSRIDRAGWENVVVLEGDVTDPPLDGPVDGILSSFLVLMFADVGGVIDTWATHVAEGTIANLYAGPSDRWYGQVPNGLLWLYVRIFEDGWGSSGRDWSPLRSIADRGERARSALEGRTDSFHHECRIYGLAQIDVGRIRTP